MAEAEIGRHVEEAKSRWPLLGVTVIHRYGRITPGENIVLVVGRVLASRGGVCRRRIPDGLSEDPRAVLEAGGRPSGKAWIEAKEADDAAAERWDKGPGSEAAE